MADVICWREDALRRYRCEKQVIAKLAKLVRNLEPEQGRIRALHEFWKKKQITGDCGRTLISYRLCEGGKSYAMSGFKLRKYS